MQSAEARSQHQIAPGGGRQQRQAAEEQVLKIGGPRNLLIPIDLSADIRAVENCIARCNARKAEREMNP